MSKIKVTYKASKASELTFTEQAAKVLATIPGGKTEAKSSAPAGSQKPKPVSGKKRADAPDKLDLLAHKLAMQRVKPQPVRRN